MNSGRCFTAFMILIVAVWGGLPHIATLHGPDPGRFGILDDGSVLDREFGLQWRSGPDAATGWRQARAFVDGLGAFDGTKWRMPTMEELRTLYAVGDGVSNIVPEMWNTGFFIWAGDSEESADRWIFSFSYGGEGWTGDPPADGGRGFAVRDWHSPLF